MPEGKDLIEDIERKHQVRYGIGHDSMDLEESDGESEEIETDIEKIPGPVKHIPPETSWKKRLTLQGYEHKSVVEEPERASSNICVFPGCYRPAVRRGCCLKCYQRWRWGTIVHPDLGIFHRMTVPELQRSRLKKLGLCLIPGCDKMGNKRNLCDRHYKMWREGLIQHPVVGEFGLKNTPSKALDKAAAEMNSAPMTATDDICLTTININLELYPQIREAVYRVAVNLSLPVSHVVVTLLAEALENRRAISK